MIIRDEGTTRRLYDDADLKAACTAQSQRIADAVIDYPGTWIVIEVTTTQLRREAACRARWITDRGHRQIRRRTRRSTRPLRRCAATRLLSPALLLSAAVVFCRCSYCRRASPSTPSL
ncbi:hypothetical protein [Streptomyces chryseus]